MPLSQTVPATPLSTLDYVVTGFYTPDYAGLADEFADGLDAFQVPHHLYPVDQSAWENAILLKPQILRRAMRDFPTKTVVLMDIDCRIRGHIAPIIPFNGDISLFMGVRYHPKSRKKSARLRVLPSSRVIVCRHTPATEKLLRNWEALCRAQDPARPEKDDEQLLMQAIGTTEGLALNIIDKRYSGRDPRDAPPDAVIIHHSAHDTVRAANEPRRYLKHLKRHLIGRIVGKPYKEWKYGITTPREGKD
jgi:hypothetical protein